MIKMTVDQIKMGKVRADERRILLHFPDGRERKYRVGGTQSKKDAIAGQRKSIPMQLSSASVLRSSFPDQCSFRGWRNETMSRHQVRNGAYTFAFGVDHTPIGCFFQIWEHAAKGENPEADEYDTPQIEGDELFGLRTNNTKTLERNIALTSAMEAIQSLRNEETIISLARSLGFDVEKKVYELWD